MITRTRPRRERTPYTLRLTEAEMVGMMGFLTAHALLLAQTNPSDPTIPALSHLIVRVARAEREGAGPSPTTRPDPASGYQERVEDLAARAERGELTGDALAAFLNANVQWGKKGGAGAKARSAG